MFAEVHRQGVTLYRTPFVRQFEFCLLTVNRQNPDYVNQIATNGPHFSIHLPNGGSTALAGKAARFDARGCGVLGSVSFVSGAAARDGWEAYELASVSAAWEADSEALSISVEVELGQPNLVSFGYAPAKPNTGNRYIISARVPLPDLARFWMISNPERMDHLKVVVATRFGKHAAESIEPYA